MLSINAKNKYPLWPLMLVLTLFLVFHIYPLLQGIYYSFTYWDGFTAKWAGLENYLDFFKNADMGFAINNTVIFAVLTTVLKVLLGLFLALFLNRKLATGNLLRAVYFSPCLLNNIAVGIIFASLLHPDLGLMNKMLTFLGLNFLVIDWLTDIRFALYSVCIIEIWKWTGFTMAIMLAGLQNIPKEFVESSQIDGANKLQKLVHITIPLMLPTFNNALLINFLGGLKVFDIVMATTRGGPGHATSVVGMVVYHEFGSGRYGYATAAQMLVGFATTIIMIAFNHFIRKNEVEL